jgi:hypothetical protein
VLKEVKNCDNYPLYTAGCFFVPPLFILLRKRIEFLSVPSYAETEEGTDSERQRKSQLVINKKRYEKKTEDIAFM